MMTTDLSEMVLDKQICDFSFWVALVPLVKRQREQFGEGSVDEAVVVLCKSF